MGRVTFLGLRDVCEGQRGKLEGSEARVGRGEGRGGGIM